MTEKRGTTADVEEAVLARYAGASQAREDALCCPTSYDARYLEVIPPEIIERDYGCGDPSALARPGDIVLDLGSGGGKIAFILSQVVGAEGQVLGVDFNDDMLALARQYQQEIGTRIGWHNVRFFKGRIQDLALKLELVDEWLQEHPVRSSADLVALRRHEGNLRQDDPMIADSSVDLVVSNCVLNLVRKEDRSRLFQEVFRVLREGGRVAISDIVSDQVVPPHLVEDARLWTGCISGAFQEQDFLRAFEAAGFHGVCLSSWSSELFAEREGIAFRSVTVTAFKPMTNAAVDDRQQVLYRGPYREVTDESGQIFRRGVRETVSGQTLLRLREGPQAPDFVFLDAQHQGRPESVSEACCQDR